MISYDPLWKTMQVRGATTYTLQQKGKISSSTIRRMQAGKSISTNTLNSLCRLLVCDIDGVIKYHPEN